MNARRINKEQGITTLYAAQKQHDVTVVINDERVCVPVWFTPSKADRAARTTHAVVKQHRLMRSRFELPLSHLTGYIH